MKDDDRTERRFSKHLNEALKDEKQAPAMYRKLKNLAETKQDKKVIASIIRDEQRHRRALSKIKRR